MNIQTLKYIRILEWFVQYLREREKFAMIMRNGDKIRDN